MITMLQNKINKTLINYALLMFISMGSIMSQQNEYESLRSQIVTLNENGRGKHKKYLPFAFTEQGIAMLSGILNSEVAINVNIAIMRTFVMIRRFAIEHKELNSKLLEMESKYEKQFSDIYEALNFIIKRDETETLQKERNQIGYKK